MVFTRNQWIDPTEYVTIEKTNNLYNLLVSLQQSSLVSVFIQTKENMKIWIVSYRDKVIRSPQNEEKKTIPCTTYDIACREGIKLLEENFILHQPHFLGQKFGDQYNDLQRANDYPGMVALYQEMVPWCPTLLIEEVKLVES